MGEQSSNEILEGLLDPIIILDRQRNIRFMNGAARRLLGEGLDLRLAAHVRSTPGMGPISQVHFKLQNGHDLILKVKIGEIEWLGEKAMQVTLSNVTAYLAMIQELQKEVAAQKQALRNAARGGAAARSAGRCGGQAPGGTRGRVRRPRQGAGRRPRVAGEPGPRHAGKHPAASRTLPGPRASATNRNRLRRRNWSRRARNLSSKRTKSAEAAQAWETERAGFVSSAAALAASLEQARQEAEAEAAQRRKAEADLKEADAAASASEQAPFQLAPGIRGAPAKRISAWRRTLAERARRESEWAAARDALESESRGARRAGPGAPIRT